MPRPDCDIDEEDLWDDETDEHEVRRQKRWEPNDDEVESMIDLADFED